MQQARPIPAITATITGRAAVPAHISVAMPNATVAEPVTPMQAPIITYTQLTMFPTDM